MATPTTHVPSTANPIATLNDSFRHSSVGGHTVITRGVAALGEAAALAILSMVRSFDAFTADNDPHGEHDFGALRWGEYELFWTISYYDPTLRFGSQDPADPTLTCRVLTVMLREEY